MNELDDNKTGLTHRATATAAAYLDALGCKPVETEVAIRDGWIADLASYWYPIMAEAKKLHLDRRAREILGVTPETQPHDFLPRAYGSGPFTVLVEVKTAWSDFKRDDRKWRPDPWPAHICFVAYPAGVVPKEDLPKGWYGLELSKNGSTLRKIHRAFTQPHPQHSGMVIDFLAAVGIRRDHRTRHAATKAWAKASRAEDREREVEYSTARLMEGLVRWIQGKHWQSKRCLADVLPELGIKKTPKYLREAIEFFESLRKDAAALGP